MKGVCSERFMRGMRGRPTVGLQIKRGEYDGYMAIDYRGGLRYPRLEKISTGEGGLDRLLQAR